MNVQRISRLLRLLQLLLAGSAQNPSGLAKTCAVSRRTVFRDIEALREAGLPVAFDSERDHYSLPISYCLPPVNLEPTESLTLLLLAFEFGQNDRLPFFDAARSAAMKLERSIPQSLRAKFRKLKKGVEIRPAPAGLQESKRQIYQQLVDCRLSGRVVRIEYDSGTVGRGLATVLRPYQLIFCRHSWYVIGKSSVHRALRAFNLSRIATLEVLDEKFKVPTTFRIERYLRNAWLLAPENGPDHDIFIRFSRHVARTVAEVRWHKTQQLEYDDDGTLIFRAQVSGLNEIVWWILSYGDQAEVIRPAQLRRLVLQRAMNMVSMYGDGQQPGRQFDLKKESNTAQEVKL